MHFLNIGEKVPKPDPPADNRPRAAGRGGAFRGTDTVISGFPRKSALNLATISLSSIRATIFSIANPAGTPLTSAVKLYDFEGRPSKPKIRPSCLISGPDIPKRRSLSFDNGDLLNFPSAENR